jgi:hypothetical protein
LDAKHRESLADGYHGPDHASPHTVRAFHVSLADRFAWPEATIEGVIANVQYFRSLAESDRPHWFFAADTDEGRWLFEAVGDGDELMIAIRQVDIDLDGGIHRYSWRHREDDAGFLTDQPIDPSEGDWRSPDAAELNVAWNSDATTGF